MGWGGPPPPPPPRPAALLVARVPGVLVRHAPRAWRASRLGPARPRGFMKPVLGSSLATNVIFERDVSPALKILERLMHSPLDERALLEEELIEVSLR